jgi:2-keto-3-deoxy-L-rhamnonate aldolase RhmA
VDIFPTTIKSKLAEGQIVVGLGTRAPRIDMAMIAKTCGFDWLFIDMEHGTLDVDSASQLSIAAISLGITPIVRVPGNEHYHSTRVLDNGAQGVIVPHVNTPEVAQSIVQNLRYPPIGHRSISGMQPVAHYKSLTMSELTNQINEETMIVVMLEAPQAIANADAIAQIDGIDVLLIGTNDLCAEMGLHGQFGHASIEKAYCAVVAACKKHNKVAGMAGVGDPKLMEKYISIGARFVAGGSDQSFMMAGACERIAFLRSIKL